MPGGAGAVLPKAALVAVDDLRIVHRHVGMWEKQALRDALAATRWNTVAFAGIKTIVAVAIPAQAARGA